MKKILLIISAISVSLLLANPPVDYELNKATDGSALGGNFILDMIKCPTDSSKLVVATGSGISVAGPVNGDASSISFKNSYVGQGGLSAVSYSHDGSTLWATTAADTFITENGLNEFLQKGTGVHKSTDNGATWTHFDQPGKTAIQGLSYDIACDKQGQVWLASFGQSLQVSPDQGQSWQVIVPADTTTKAMAKRWSPVQNPGHRVFAVHNTPTNRLWIGTADGIFLNTNPFDSLSVDTLAADAYKGDWHWINTKAGSGKLTGNFVTAIQSQTLSNGKEALWAATWSAGSNTEIDGVSMTLDSGKTWQQFLKGEKVYNFGFKGDSVYVCAESGLWMADENLQFEKFNLKVYSNARQAWVTDEIQKVYSFYYLGGKMWIGTGKGLLVSSDSGNTFTYFEAYQQEKEKVYAYPNPFSPQRFGINRIYFNMANAGNVSCTIYNFAMEKVVEVTKNASYTAGDHYLTWNGRDAYNQPVANGVYFFVVKKNGKELWNKILVFD